MSNFTIAEFQRSDLARRHGWDNAIPPEYMDNAYRTLEMLERIRTVLWRQAGFECPMLISSGYRCLVLNRAVGSADSSSHNLALAADWTAPKFGSPTKICRLLAEHIDAVQISQLINEFPGGDGEGWCHTGADPQARPINRIITIDRQADGKVATLPGILDSFV